MSTTSLIARQCRLREWAQMVQDCKSRPEEMSVDEWCEAHSITKANYYYRMTQVRKACLEALPKEVVEQAIVPVPMELMSIDEHGSSETEADSFLELESNGITVRVTQQTSTELLSKVLGVIAHVK
ncbi:MAG: IS66 family insertion sequence element accessory protein TnpB [Lachnospiraceae bacterium]|nr:IS66 family insertion sequence element accessory protein TnpB [Lachnospiraceae bacterium]